MARWMFAWVGNTDLKACEADGKSGVGPIARALIDRGFDRTILINNYTPAAGKSYLEWVERKTRSRIELRQVALPSPTDYEAISRTAMNEISRALSTVSKPPELTFHLSPGTPAMTAVWIILAKTRYGAELIQSSLQEGVQTVQVPFELSAEFIPAVVRGADADLSSLQDALRPTAPEFGNILHRSTVMRELLQRAERCAAYSVPVLIEGESGTGKEMLAQAIHKASPRSAKPFVVVNCGAIPTELVESEFFGHEKGAFTGAAKDKKGRFEEAHGGTLFLDEIGELPASAQVKLLRALQEGTIARVGASTDQKVDVRVVAATNRDLAAEVAAGRFREDLFYRLAVLVLRTPPLRERAGDVGLLIEDGMARLNEQERRQGRPEKKLSPKAKNLLLHHAWTGNVRELNATLLRAVVWAHGATLAEDDVRIALRAGSGVSSHVRVEQEIGDGFNLEGHLDELSRGFIKRALEQGKTKVEAARLVGFRSHQRLSDWMVRLGMTS